MLLLVTMAQSAGGPRRKLTLGQGAVMLILEAVLLGMSLFVIGVLIYMFAAPKLIGNGNVSLDSPFPVVSIRSFAGSWLRYRGAWAVDY